MRVDDVVGNICQALPGGSSLLAKEVRFAGAIVNTGEAVMGWALPLGGGKYCAAPERLEPMPPASSFAAAAAAADDTVDDAVSDYLRIEGVNASPAAAAAAALCVGAATRQRLFGEGCGEATDIVDEAQAPATMLITGGLGALGTAVTIWAACKVGRNRFRRVETSVESAWSQCLNLEYDEPSSNFAFL
jgi:hypothetical protein